MHQALQRAGFCRRRCRRALWWCEIGARKGSPARLAALPADVGWPRRALPLARRDDAARAAPHLQRREVSLVLRDTATQRVVHETSALHEDVWTDDPAIFGVLFDAAPERFPRSRPVDSRQVRLPSCHRPAEMQATPHHCRAPRRDRLERGHAHPGPPDIPPATAPASGRRASWRAHCGRTAQHHLRQRPAARPCHRPGCGRCHRARPWWPSQACASAALASWKDAPSPKSKPSCPSRRAAGASATRTLPRKAARS